MNNEENIQIKSKVRLDKWLWAARFFKTRGIAKDAVDSGKVHYNGERVKVSKEVEINALIQVRQGWDEKTVLVMGLSNQRRGATEAQALYKETTESVEKRLAQAELRKQMQQHLIAPETKPNKKDRRLIHQFKQKSVRRLNEKLEESMENSAEKKSSDCLQSFIFENVDIRGSIVTLADGIVEMFQTQHYEIEKQNLLAQFVAANVLLASHLEIEGSLSLQAQSTVGIDLIMSECRDAEDSLHYRGIVRGESSIANMSFADIFSQAILVLTMAPKNGAQYQGVVPTSSASLAGCLQDYYAQSEQLPTWFCFFSSDSFSSTSSSSASRVTGLMLQALPAQVCRDAEQSVENWNRIVHLASTLTQHEAHSLSHAEILYRLYHEEVVRLYEPKSVKYQCNCSAERMERGLLSLGKVELTEILTEQEKIKTQCHFCNKEYYFSHADIYKLLQGAADQKTH